MNFGAVVDLGRQTLNTLVHASPSGYLAMGVMGVLFVVAVIGLLRASKELRRQEDGLDWLYYNMRATTSASYDDYLPAPVGDGSADAASAADFSATVGQPERRQLQTYDLDLQYHAHRVYNVVLRHGRLAAPNPEVVAAAARAYSPPGLIRQRTTQNIILLVGLAGTVLGLAAAVAEVRLGFVGGTTATAAPAFAISAFEGVLEQLPTAFVSTIWGILLALTFGPVASAVEARAAKFTDDVEQKALADWIPDRWPEAVEAQLEDLRKVMDKTHRTAKLTGQVVKDTTEELGKVLQHATTEMGQHVTGLAAVTNESQGLFSRLSAEVNASVAALQGGTSEMSASIQQLRTFHSEVTGAYARMQGLFEQAQSEAKEQVERTLEATENQQKQFLDTTTGLFLRLDNMTGRFDASSQALDEQKQVMSSGFTEIGMNMHRAVHEVLDNATQRLNETTSGLTGVTHTLVGAVSGLESVVGSSLASSEGRQALDRLAKAVSELQTGSETLVSGLAASRSLADYAAELRDLMGRFVAASDALDRFSSAGTASPRDLDRDRTLMLGLARSYGESLKNMVDVLKSAEVRVEESVALPQSERTRLSEL